MKSRVLQKIYLILLILPCLLFGDNSLSKVDLGKYPIKLQGFLDDKTITMHLVQNADKFEGLYYYEGFKRYLKLEGQLEPNSKLRVSEFNQKGSNTGDFIGEFNAQEFKGIWSKPDGSRSYSFSLYLMKGQINGMALEALSDQKGEENNSSNSKYLDWISVVAVFGLVGLGFVFYKRKSSKKEEVKTKYVEVVKSKTLNKESKEKGDAFESHVASLFTKKSFRILSVTPDKVFDGKFVESNTHPDFKMAIIEDGKKFVFAVECKYRTSINPSYKFEICTEKQFFRYREFGINENLDVFIVLGTGGTANNPQELYIIPLTDLKDHTIQHSEFSKYKKKIKSHFSYNTTTGVLS